MKRSLRHSPLPFLRKVFLGLAIGVAAPVMLSYIAFFGFVTNYTSGVFSLPGIHAQYDHGIYRYRILGKELIDAEQHWLATHPKETKFVLNNPLGYPSAKLEASADPYTYAAYFLLNTEFMVLFGLTAFCIFRSRWYQLGEFDAAIRSLVMIAIIQFSLFVVTFYDTPVYFLMAVGWWIALSGGRYAPWMMVPIVMLATLFRESSLFIVAMFAALQATRRQRLPSWLVSIAPSALAFAVVYVWLRYRYGWSTGIYEGLPLDLSKAGIALLFCFAFIAPVLLTANRTLLRFASWLALFSIPYLYVLFRGANLIEVRLYVPYVIALFLAAGVRELGSSSPYVSRKSHSLPITQRREESGSAR